MEPRIVPYSKAVGQLHTGDLLLFRDGDFSLLGDAITVAGRSAYSHAAMFAWWDGVPMVMEMRGFTGGRSVYFENLLELEKREIDVYRPKLTKAECRAIAREMKKLTGKNYGWVNLARASLAHLPVTRWVFKVPTDDKINGHYPPFCSQAYALSMRTGSGKDPVPNLADRATEPGDLGRSALFDYRLTILADDDPKLKLLLA